MNKMEYIKVQILKDNINYIKGLGSFAKVINTLIIILKESPALEEEVKERLKSL